jgi:hypothetical protein
MGSTGYQPVLVGNLPTRRRKTHSLTKRQLWGKVTRPAFRRAGSPAGRASCPCYPLAGEARRPKVHSQDSLPPQPIIPCPARDRVRHGVLPVYDDR